MLLVIGISLLQISDSSDYDTCPEPETPEIPQPCEEDRGQSNTVYSEHREPQEEKPAAYHQQHCQAAKLLQHIDTILALNENSKGSVKHYTDVYLQIYTAKSINLQTQTIQRLIDPKAQVFRKEAYDDMGKLHEDAKLRVQLYSEDVIEKRHKHLVSQVERCPDTLFIIIADEAHFAVTKETGGKKKQAANDMLINSWLATKHPNVIILQVRVTDFLGLRIS